MGLFEKKETVFKKQNRQQWLAAREKLKEAGIRSVRAGDYEVEPPVCGCGSKLDPRNFGKNGHIDRRMYYIDVPVTEAKRVRELLGALLQ